MKFNTVAVLSFLTAFAAAKPSNKVNFPPNEHYLEYSGKNGLYLLNNNGGHFPEVFLAENCSLNLGNNSIECLVRDQGEYTTINKKFGGAARLSIRNMREYNYSNCDVSKNIVEVVPYDQEGHVQQSIGYLNGETLARRIGFTNTDGCKYYFMFDNFTLEKY